MTLTLILGGLLATAIVMTQVVLLRGLARAQTRITERLAEITLRVSLADPFHPSDAAAAASPIVIDDPAGERLAPWFALPTLAGGQGSLASLLATGRPVVLAFAEPRCGPCYDLLPDIANWQRMYGDRLTCALVSSGAPARNQAMTAEYGIDASYILLQENHETAEAFGVPSLPAAVLIDPDGRIRTVTASGVTMIRATVAGALGLDLRPQPVVASDTVAVARRGDPAPALRRPDLMGNPIDFGALRGRPTTVLFWSPGCTSCDELLPSMRSWEGSESPMRLLVVTSGPVGLNLEAGLRSPFVPDEDGTVRRAFGVEATPSALVIDGHGVILTSIARGARAVRVLGDMAFDPSTVRTIPATSVPGLDSTRQEVTS